MPLESKAQGRFLNWKFGHDWVNKHHFGGPQKGLPQYAQKGNANIGLHIFRQHVAVFRPKSVEGQHPRLPQYPADHQVGMEVPVGGSSCAKCKFLGKDGASCGNDMFQHWNFDNAKLPAQADRYCCDFFDTRDGASRNASRA